MSSRFPSFSLAPDSVIEVPHGHLCYEPARSTPSDPSDQRCEFVYRLDPRSGGQFAFRPGSRGKVQGVVLFTPKRLQGGEQLRVLWVETPGQAFPGSAGSA